MNTKWAVKRNILIREKRHYAGSQKEGKMEPLLVLDTHYI